MAGSSRRASNATPPALTNPRNQRIESDFLRALFTWPQHPADVDSSHVFAKRLGFWCLRGMLLAGCARPRNSFGSSGLFSSVEWIGERMVVAKLGLNFFMCYWYVAIFLNSFDNVAIVLVNIIEAFFPCMQYRWEYNSFFWRLWYCWVYCGMFQIF